MATEENKLEIPVDQTVDPAENLSDGSDFKMDPKRLAELTEKLQELRRLMSDGAPNQDDALKMLKNKRNSYVPTSYEYLLFWGVLAVVILVFGKQRTPSVNTTIFIKYHSVRNRVKMCILYGFCLVFLSR